MPTIQPSTQLAPLVAVWNDIDGTRDVQFTTSVSLPGAFQDRLFETWITWEEKVEFDGRRTYILAICPLDRYRGTHRKVDGAEKMSKATSRGVYIVKEITDNTCEWTRVQQADLKISLPARVMDIVVKQHLSWANQLQEKFRRNGKEVDREAVAALVEMMEQRRGVALIKDQVVAFKRCFALLGAEDGEGWKPLASPSPDVEMKIKYFPPKNGERSIGTGKAVGVIDCTAEEVAAWVMDYTGIERMRVNVEEGNLAR